MSPRRERGPPPSLRPGAAAWGSSPRRIQRPLLEKEAAALGPGVARGGDGEAMVSVVGPVLGVVVGGEGAGSMPPLLEKEAAALGPGVTRGRDGELPGGASAPDLTGEAMAPVVAAVAGPVVVGGEGATRSFRNEGGSARAPTVSSPAPTVFLYFSKILYRVSV